ncbi:rhodanese-like domain-containing protein [Chloroflexota bacterium]
MKRESLLILLVSLALAIISLSIAGCITQETIDITAQEAFSLIQKNKDNPDFVIIDVRTPEEFVEGYLENALNINFNSENFSANINKLDKDKTYLVYCRSGNRSGRAVSIMTDLGFKEVYDMGGITNWTTEGFPIVN